MKSLLFTNVLQLTLKNLFFLMLLINLSGCFLSSPSNRISYVGDTASESSLGTSLPDGINSIGYCVCKSGQKLNSEDLCNNFCQQYGTQSIATVFIQFGIGPDIAIKYPHLADLCNGTSTNRKPNRCSGEIINAVNADPIKQPIGMLPDLPDYVYFPYDYATQPASFSFHLSEENTGNKTNEVMIGIGSSDLKATTLINIYRYNCNEIHPFSHVDETGNTIFSFSNTTSDYFHYSDFFKPYAMLDPAFPSRLIKCTDNPNINLTKGTDTTPATLVPAGSADPSLSIDKPENTRMNSQFALKLWSSADPDFMLASDKRMLIEHEVLNLRNKMAPLIGFPTTTQVPSIFELLIDAIKPNEQDFINNNYIFGPLGTYIIPQHITDNGQNAIYACPSKNDFLSTSDLYLKAVAKILGNDVSIATAEVKSVVHETEDFFVACAPGMSIIDDFNNKNVGRSPRMITYITASELKLIEASTDRLSINEIKTKLQNGISVDFIMKDQINGQSVSRRFRLIHPAFFDESKGGGLDDLCNPKNSAQFNVLNNPDIRARFPGGVMGCSAKNAM